PSPSFCATSPVALSRPPIRVSNVDVPLPEGPMIAVTRPVGTCSETRFKAGSPEPEPYRLVTSESWTSVSITASLLNVEQGCGDWRRVASSRGANLHTSPG